MVGKDLACCSRMDFNAAHIHLAINHSPLFAEIFAFCLIVFGLWRARREFVTAALVVAIIAALCGVAADLSGDKAADLLTKANPPIAGVDTKLIGEHDDAAGGVIHSFRLPGRPRLLFPLLRPPHSKPTRCL